MKFKFNDSVVVTDKDQEFYVGAVGRVIGVVFNPGLDIQPRYLVRFEHSIDVYIWEDRMVKKKRSSSSHRRRGWS